MKLNPMTPEDMVSVGIDREIESINAEARLKDIITEKRKVYPGNPSLTGEELAEAFGMGDLYRKSKATD